MAGVAQKAGRGNAEPALLPLLIGALVVARAVFVARHSADYSSVLAMIDIRDRGFDPWAGWAAAAAGVAFWAWRRPALRMSLPLSASAGAAIVLAGMGALTLLQPARPLLPDLTLQTLQGRPVALASLRGQPLVVNLWATWCPPCRRELPLLIGLIQTFAIGIDLSPEDFLQGLGMNVGSDTFGHAVLSLKVSQLAPVLPYLLMVLILIFRPRGLMGKRES